MGVIVFVVYSISYNIHGQQFVGPVAQGVGGAGRSATEVSESVFLNPASLAHAPEYSLGMYSLQGVPRPGRNETTFGVTIVDNHRGVVLPGAVSYIQSHKSFEGLPGVDEQMWQVSLGNFVYRQLALGLSLYHLEQTEPKRRYVQWNGTLGLHWNPYSRFALGLVYYHLLEPRDKTPDHLKLQPAWGMGITYVAFKFLRFKLDTTLPRYRNPENKLTYHGGMESSFSKYLTLRIGYEADKFASHSSYTLGMTLKLPRWRLDYFFKRLDQEKETMHGVDLRIPI